MTGPLPTASSRNRRYWIALASIAAVAAVCMVARQTAGPQPAHAQTGGVKPATAEVALPKPTAPQHDVMALVNGQDISRAKLGDACVSRFGEDVLESLVNKRLILHHCAKRQITVTTADIEAEIDRMAKRFRLGREQWLELLEKERGVTIQEYKRDILWPTIALRKLAADQLVVSEEDLQKAYDMQYGPAVQARILVLDNADRAAQLQRELSANPTEFARVAMTESVDEASASIGGLIHPIRRHMGDRAIEDVVFGLQAGKVSTVIPVANQFVILKCERQMEPRNVPLAAVREELTEQIKESKLRNVASDLFQKLQDTATIQNVKNDPQLSQRLPGVVATVNGEQITMDELRTEALLRHGEEVLEIEISHLLLEQSLKSANVTVTQQDLDQEIAHAAQLAGFVGTDGQPQVEEWVKTTCEEQAVTYQVYVRDSVWPSAALKKLSGSGIEVTEEDLSKGYEANYGERVQCRAIVMGNMRQAQEVWAKARQNAAMEFFGTLAEEYSIEPTSKSLQGEVPPLRRWGGQPQLEEVAFKLQPGELSGIVQVGDKFVILKCEGRTKPVAVDMAEVRDILLQDIREKKLRVAMSEKFDDIRRTARIDNYLAGTSQAPLPRGEKTAQRVDGDVHPASTR